MDFIMVDVQKGDEYFPTTLKIRFAPTPWYCCFRNSRYNFPTLNKKELEKEEARHAIETFIYQFKKELEEAVEKGLGITL